MPAFCYVKHCEKCGASSVVTEHTVDRPQPCGVCGHADAEARAYQRDLADRRRRARSLRERGRCAASRRQ